MGETSCSLSAERRRLATEAAEARVDIVYICRLKWRGVLNWILGGEGMNIYTPSMLTTRAELIILRLPTLAAWYVLGNAGRSWGEPRPRPPRLIQLVSHVTITPRKATLHFWPIVANVGMGNLEHFVDSCCCACVRVILASLYKAPTHLLYSLSLHYTATASLLLLAYASSLLYSTRISPF